MIALFIFQRGSEDSLVKELFTKMKEHREIFNVRFKRLFHDMICNLLLSKVLIRRNNSGLEDKKDFK